MDYQLMQRLSNDPSADQFNATPKYAACAACATAGQYTGMFIDSTSASELQLGLPWRSPRGFLRLNK